MSSIPVYKKLEKKYHKTEEVTNFKDLLYRSASIYKERIAFKLKNKNKQIYSVTYEQLKNDVEALGTSLISQGLFGKRICVIGKNSYKWAISYFMNISVSFVILGDDKNLEVIINSKDKLSNQNMLFINFDASKENQLSFDYMLNKGYDLIKIGEKSFERIEVDPDEMKILLFTSGTTGNAKGVCLSHRNICSNILSIYGIVKVKRNDLFLSILPIHHTYECTIGFLLPLYGGASIAFCDGLRYITDNINEYHPSVVLCVPLLLENMYKKIIKSINNGLPEKYKKQDENPFYDLPFFIKAAVKSKVKNSLGGRIRVFIVGAAAMNPKIIEDFDSLGLRTLQGYGLTECSPLVAGNTDYFSKSDSCGLPIPNVEYKIDSPNEEGVGEILVKGPNVMLGYYNNLTDTNKVLVDGWFHTGDLGKIDEDGYLYITGRCKSVIVTKNGKNIYPEEVEYYLNDNPLISESLVSGIHKDNDDETYINAQIFPNIEAITEQLKGSVPTKEEIKKIMSDIVKSVNSKLPNYKHIKSFIVRDEEFEKTTTKKIKRFGKNMDVNKKD